MEDKLKKRIECDNCSFETQVETYNNPGGKDCKLCEICAETHLGKATAFPEQVSDVKLYKSIAWIANRILQEIAEFQARVVNIKE